VELWFRKGGKEKACERLFAGVAEKSNAPDWPWRSPESKRRKRRLFLWTSEVHLTFREAWLSHEVEALDLGSWAEDFNFLYLFYVGIVGGNNGL